jgi:hypothetical protein
MNCSFRRECPHPGEHQGEAGSVGGLDHFVVAQRAAGLEGSITARNSEVAV